MSLITDTWRQIVQRRLWPVALLLLAALVAVPVLLAKDPAPVPVPATVPVTTGSASDATATPIVAQATSVDDSRRHVLGARKDPFRPAELAKPTPTPSSTTSTTSTATLAQAGGGASTAAPTSVSKTSGSGTTTTGPSGTGSTGTSTPSTPATGGGGGTTPAAPQPATKPKDYPLYSLTVRFGDASGELTKQRLTRLQALPDADAPVAIYLGPGADKRSAVFLVDADVTPEGDGTCKPYLADCQTVILRKGETEFFDVKDPTTGAVTATYELDLIDIVRKTTASARRAKAARAATSKAGAKALKAHLAQDGPVRWAYDKGTGTVGRLDKRTWKATVAKAGGQVARVVAVLQPSL
jgi:hypothetical protein